MIIAIDGHSSCGKSTVSKEVAKRLGLIYIDTGAMYRAFTYYLLINGIDYKNDFEEGLFDKIKISFKNIDGKNVTFLNDINVENEIRSLEISKHVSPVSTISEVRTFLVEQQREMGANGNVVMDGRDISSVVFPNADLKIFMTANVDVRALRRKLELEDKGMSDVSLYDIESNLLERDLIDSTRSDSPLIQVEDAYLLDTTDLGVEDCVQKVMDLVNSLLSC